MKCMSTYLKFNPHCVCWGGCECLCGICVTWLIVHDSFHVTWLIVRDRTHLVWLNWRGITPCVCHGSLCVTWLILCDTTHAVVPDASVRVVVFVSALWYTPDIAYFSWLVLHNMTHHTWHDSFCVTWLVLRDMNHHTWHDSLCVMWLVLRDMTHAVVPEASVRVVAVVSASNSAHAALNRGCLAVNGNICMYMYTYMCVSARLCVCVCVSVSIRLCACSADSWASRF